MSLLKLKPSCKDYLWGGRRLAEEYNKSADTDVIAETWELSCYPDSPSYIVNGADEGKTLSEYIKEKGTGVLGTNCEKFTEFPILIKFIDAAKDLSIQVHPDNVYAEAHEHQQGKTEMWYVMDAAPGAFLYYGFTREVSKEEFRERIDNNTLTEVLNAVPVKKGDAFFIEAGTIHAIGAGCLIAEIQQNSNVTYRVYDYGRKDKNGKTRELHVAKALDVTDRRPVKPIKNPVPHIENCSYFTVDKVNLDGECMRSMYGYAGQTSFVHFLFLEGEGMISCGGDALPFKKGDSFFIPANSGDFNITGTCEALMTTERGVS